MKTLQENLNMATQLLSEGLNYVVREDNNTVVACTNEPIKFHHRREWGTQQTLGLTEKAKPIAEDYFPIIAYDDEHATALSDLKTGYTLALRVLAQEDDEYQVPPVVNLLHSIHQNGMKHLVRQPNNDIAVFESTPVKDTQRDEWISSNPYEFRTLLSPAQSNEDVFDDIQADDKEPVFLVDFLSDFDLDDEE